MRWAAILAVPLGIAIIIGMLRLGVVQKQITSGREKLHTLLARFSDNSKNKKSEVKTQETSVLPVGEVVSSLIDDSTSGPDSTTGDVNNLTNEKEDAFTEQKARFAVIVGAFRQEDNARKLVSDLQAQGNEALVYDQSRTGLFRVALGTFTDQAEAMKLLDIARSGDFPGAWVLKNQ
jgi:cell division protein FtsN